MLLLSCNLQQTMNHVSTITLITSDDPAWLETNSVEYIVLAHFDGLVQEICNSSALTLELCL